MQQALAAQRQIVTAKAGEVKAEIVAAVAKEKLSATTSLDQMRSRMGQARDKAVTTLETRAEAARNRVRSAAASEHAKLAQSLTQHQQSARRVGATLAQSALQQASAQGDRVQQGALQRSQRARAIGDRWAGEFSALEGGASAATTVRSRSQELAGQIQKGAAEGRKSCVEQGQKIATELRAEAETVATGLADKTKEAQSRIDQDRDEALASINDGAKGAHDALLRSFEQSLQQVDEKKQQALAAYDQLGSAAVAQVDAGLAELLPKLETVGKQLEADLLGLTSEAKQYAIAPEVTAELNAGLARTAAQYEAKLAELGATGVGALAAVEVDACGAAQQQSQTVQTGIDQAVSGLQANLNDKVHQASEKIDEVATSVTQSLGRLTAGVDRDLRQGVAKGQDTWQKQIHERIDSLGEHVDRVLSQHDGQLARLDRELSQQYTDTKKKCDDAKQDKPWYEAAWDAVVGFVSSAWDFVTGVVVGIYEGFKELLSTLWELLKTPLGWLVLAGIILLTVIIVVLVGWEALIIAGLVIGLCMAAYYVYLAVTTPGLDWHSRGKLFGKALFNLALGFVGVEFEGSNLLRFTQWGGLIPRGIRLVQEVGSLSKAIELIRLVGGVRRALELVEALGSAERVIELARQVGGAKQLATLLERCGGVEKLLSLLAHPKIGDIGVLNRLLSNSKISNIGSLETLLGHAKIADVATLETLLANSKVVDAEVLVKLLNNAKIADVAVLEKLLGNAKITDAVSLERLLSNPKLADIASLEDLLSIPNVTINELENLLQLTAMTAVDLKELLQLPGMTAERLTALYEKLLSFGVKRPAKNIKSILQNEPEFEAILLSGRFDACQGWDLVVSQTAIPSMTKGAMAVLREAEQLLSQGFRIIFERSQKSAPTFDVDLAVVDVQGAIIDAFAVKRVQGLKNIADNMTKAVGQLVNAAVQGTKNVVVHVQRGTKLELEATDFINGVRNVKSRNPQIQFKIVFEEDGSILIL